MLVNASLALKKLYFLLNLRLNPPNRWFIGSVVGGSHSRRQLFHSEKNVEVSGRLSGSELLKRPFPKSLRSDDAFADLRAIFFQSELVLDELRRMRSGWKVTSRLLCCWQRSAGFRGSV